MLRDEQVIDLLEACENRLGKRLSQIRGGFRRAGTRAPFVWELLVLSESLHLGAVDYEPEAGGSPDVRLTPENGRPLWIEAKFLFPRFWREERISGALPGWIFAEAERHGVQRNHLSVRLDGDRSDRRGPVRTLPELHEEKLFRSDPVLREFFEKIRGNPSSPAQLVLNQYSVLIGYEPHAQSHPGISGLVQEAPRDVEEHMLYRALSEKAKQHDVRGPLIIAVGSDQSPALSRMHSPLAVSYTHALNTALSRCRSLSAALIVRVENVTVPFFGVQPQARAELHCNPWARHPLTEAEAKLLCKMNFARWAYSAPLRPWETDPNGSHRRLGGHLEWTPGRYSMDVKVPINIIVDALGGRTTLAEEFGEDHPVVRAFREGWSVRSCKVVDARLEAGEPAKLHLELMDPVLSGFSSKKKKT